MSKLVKGLIVLLIVSSAFYSIAYYSEIKQNSKVFDIEISTEINNGEYLEFETKLINVYKYLSDYSHEMSKTKYIMASYNRINKENNLIYVDYKNINDYDLVKMILLSQYSEYTNFGLVNGLIYDILIECSLDYDEVTLFTPHELSAFEELNILYLYFNSKMTDEENIKVSEYLSIKLYQNIINNLGKEYFVDLLTYSYEPSVNREVQQLLYDWLKDYGVVNINRRIGSEIFDMTSPNDEIKFLSRNIEWTVNLDNKDPNELYLKSINTDIDSFNSYMDIYYREIARLENLFDFSHLELERLNIDLLPIAPELVKEGGRFYGNTISLYTGTVFSHEYIHFIDEQLENDTTFSALKEMRAVYFSKDFEITLLELESMIKAYKSMYQKDEVDKLGIANPITALEDYYEHEITVNEFILLNDLILQIYLKSGEELPDIYGTSGTYPSQIWISLIAYIERTYGFEAIDSVSLNQKLPNGSVKDMTKIIEEWKVYLINLSILDYSRYY